MKGKVSLLLFSVFFSHSITSFAQVIPSGLPGPYGAVPVTGNDAGHPCITALQYAVIENRCAENTKALGLEKAERSIASTLLNWPVQAADGFTDCSYYAISAYVDQNTNTGAISDYECGSHTYDGHRGTDIFTWPFPFYKMDNDQVNVTAAAAGIIIDKHDGEFDRNCTANSLPANYVIIRHADGSHALYWHMKSGSVTDREVGQAVVAGEYLGVVGSSGSSTGPHLHFEVWSGNTGSTYNDPYFGPCNTLNSGTWWAIQKPYTEPGILKASVHTTDILMPGCPTTEIPNEAAVFTIPFQGPGLAPGYAKFYIFLRNAPVGTTASLKILNPDGSTFNSWDYSVAENYSVSYWGWSKLLPTEEGTYAFVASYNGMTCSQNFDVLISNGISTISDSGHFQIYPNPSRGNFTLKSDQANAEIEIFNLLGKVVYRSEISRGMITIYPGLTEGVYFFQVKNNKQYISCGKLVVQ